LISSTIGAPVHIEAYEPAHVGQELFPDRLVEPEPLALDVDGFLRHRGAFPGHAQFHDVARHDAHEEEDQDGHAEQGRNHEQQALHDVFGHTVAR
jgi:hypothetical protein